MKRLAGFLAALVLTAGPALAVNQDVVMADKPARTLSAYELFTDMAAQEPAKGVVPYDLNTPLFTDYAAKFRFVHLPDGQSAPYNDSEVFDFPVGTVLVKTFAYPADYRKPDDNIRLIETRLLIHKTDGWVAFPYVWNDEQTEAVLKVAGARTELTWIDDQGQEKGTRYVVPNINQCKGCHIYNKAMTPIGPKARNINKDFAYADGTKNQIAVWSAHGILTGAPDPADAPRVPNAFDLADGSLEKRARAYLDVNCAHCHRAGGPGDTSGLFLTWDEDNPVTYGVEKRPVAAGRGSGGLDFDIAPGKPDQSIIIFRMSSTEPGIAMPELGRTINHDEGIALVREWIAALDE